MILQSIFNMIEELKDVKSVKAGLQKSIHALKCCLSEVQAIIHSMLERTHLYFTDQFFLKEELWKKIKK